MRKIVLILSFFSSSVLCHIIKQKHIILPRQLHVGQEFIFEGIPYIITGFDQKRSATFEKVKLILEYPIRFGLELGTETIILKIKHGKDNNNDIIYNTNIQHRFHDYNWKTYLLAYLFIRYFLPPIISISH